MSAKVLKYGGTLDLLRRAEDLTHEELAKDSMVDVKTVERACAGCGVLTIPHFLRMLKVLKPDMVKRIMKVFPPEDFEQEGPC